MKIARSGCAQRLVLVAAVGARQRATSLGHHRGGPLSIVRMMSYACRAGNLSPFVKAVTQVVASGTKPVANAAPAGAALVIDRQPAILTHASMQKAVFVKSSVKAVACSAGSVRFAHTDIEVPDFSAYRRKSTKEPTAINRESAEGRRSFTYLMVGGGSIAGVYGAKTVVSEFVSSMSASADVLALAKIEVKLGDIPEGKSTTFKWRGKPLFIRHRTQEEISHEESVDIAVLRDPQKDSERVQKPEWLILIGVCTHLGCVPIANAGDFGGYYCPCHGSHYDASGRIRKGPAPLNLEIPPYEFPDETSVIVG